MDKQELVKILENKLTGSCQVDAPLSQHTSFRIGGPADVLIQPANKEDVLKVIRFAQEEKLPLTILGNGSNLLVRDKGIRGLVLKLGNNLKALTRRDNVVSVESGFLLGALARQVGAWGLSGLEFASGIPGSLGGAVVMNAGAYGGEIKDVLQAVTALSPQGELRCITKEELELSYRHSILQTADFADWVVLEVELLFAQDDVEVIKARMDDYSQRRLTKQPLDLPSGGSMFKRPQGYFAAALIEEAGLKGFTVGGAQVSTKHAGFVVNTGGATAQDVLALVKAVQGKVYDLKGIVLEMEVRVIGEE